MDLKFILTLDPMLIDAGYLSKEIVEIDVV